MDKITNTIACPFCGNHRKDWIINAKDQQKYRIWCEQCGALGPPGETREEAAEKWNVRAGGQITGASETVGTKAVALQGLVMPRLVDAHDCRSCDTCDSQEGHHYCLLHTVQIKNMDTVRCSDWTQRHNVQALRPAEKPNKHS